MSFPEKPRVIYHHNPLDIVVCQLRFPPILRIVSNIPADFQDKVRLEFPLFVDDTGNAIELPTEFMEKIPGDFFSALQIEKRKRYTFSTEDDSWVVNLEQDFIALTAQNYIRWEEFERYFRLPLEALHECYSPAFYVRTGLRYRNIIRRSELNLEGVEWSELLNERLAGVLSDEIIYSDIKNSSGTLEIKLDDGQSIVRIKHGLVMHKESGELCYLIDNDFFTTQKIGVNNAVDKLKYFNTKSGNLFRWCITEKLHDAMEPNPS